MIENLELNRIYHGDCLEVMKGIPDGSVDMILCDLPYGTTRLEWDNVIPFDQLWEQYFRVGKENAAFVLTAQQPFATDLINSCRKHFRYEIIWHKVQVTGFLDANRRPLRSHENILVFYRKSPVYNPQKNKSTTQSFTKTRYNSGGYGGYNEFRKPDYAYTEDGTRFPTSVLTISSWNGVVCGNKTASATMHPTQKPVPLFEWLIKTYTNEGETVLDNCSGSGTTAIASIRNNRNYICIEKNEQYYNDSLKRVENEKYKLF